VVGGERDGLPIQRDREQDGGGVTVPALLLAEGVLTAAAAGIVYVLLRQRRSGFDNAEQRATLRTLALATSTMRELRRGLSARSAARVLPEVAQQAGTDAVALYGTGGLLAFHAHRVEVAAPHRVHLVDEAPAVVQAMNGARLRLLRPHTRGESAPCELRTAIVAPLVVAEKPVAALVGYVARRPAPADLRIVSDLAELLATQLRLQEADRQRVALSRSELRALRAQISPHFIYNALTTIAAFIRTDPDRARQLLLDFAEFSRRAFRTPQDEFSALADELVYVNQYLVLEQARLGERLAVRYHIEPEALSVTVPTLVLQPLVENAVKHGIEAVAGTRTITIRADDDNEECVVSVADDGAGFVPGAVVDETGQAGALANIDHRLRRVFGPQYGLAIDSAPGRGTTVRLRVPKYRPGVQPHPEVRGA
jgi:two-component system, LytTR family, sensor kinase